MDATDGFAEAVAEIVCRGGGEVDLDAVGEADVEIWRSVKES